MAAYVDYTNAYSERNGPDSLLRVCLSVYLPYVSPPSLLPFRFCTPFPQPLSCSLESLSLSLSLVDWFPFFSFWSLDFQTTSERRGKMLLGKRQRPPMKRTTSMTEFTLDLGSSEPPLSSDPINPFKPAQLSPADQRFLSATVSPRNHRRNSADFVDTAHFLRSCSLCKRRLVPSRDIYMYRGDSAFCSLECRQQQMNQDERKEKCSMASKKQSGSKASGSEVVSTKGETVTAM